MIKQNKQQTLYPTREKSPSKNDYEGREEMYMGYTPNRNQIPSNLDSNKNKTQSHLINFNKNRVSAER